MYQIDNSSRLEGIRHRNRKRTVDAAARALRRKRRRSWPTARSMSARTAENSSSFGPAPTGRNSEHRGTAGQHEQLLRIGRHAGADPWRVPPFRAAASSLCPATPSMPSGRGRRSRSPVGLSTNLHSRATGAPAHLQVVPTELVLDAGQKVNLRARLFDDKGRFLREEQSNWSLDGLERHCRWTAPSPWRAIRRTGRPDQGDRRRTHRRGPGARRSPAAVERNLRVVRRWRVPPGGSMRWPAKFRVATLDGQKVLAEAAGQHDFQAGARVSSVRRTGPTTRSRRMSARRAAPTDGRRRDYGAALFTGSLRQFSAVETRALGAGDSSHRHGAVRLEARYLVPPEASRRESAGRQGASSGQSMARWRSRACGLDDRSCGSRSATAKERPGLFIDAQFGAYLDNFKSRQISSSAIHCCSKARASARASGTIGC